MRAERTANKISKIVELCIADIRNQLYLKIPKREQDKIIKESCFKHGISEGFIRKVGEWNPTRLY